MAESFSDYATMTKFPEFEPPESECMEPTCLAREKVLKACPCSLRRGLRGYRTRDLKDMRLRYHPDKFCMTRQPGEWQRKAQEMFVMLTELIESR